MKATRCAATIYLLGMLGLFIGVHLVIPGAGWEQIAERMLLLVGALLLADGRARLVVDAAERERLRDRGPFR